MKFKTILLFICILAFFLRLYQLGRIPISLEWDEVAIGYDAYSLLRTGKDQFGQFLPITFRSLDDYKPPIYEYITIPSIFLFGLNEFSVRLPTALFGVISVIATFLLGKAIFPHFNGLKNKSTKISLFASFLLAISPWHIQFSRAAFEVNLAVLITILAVVTFLKGLSNPKFFLLSALFFGMELFSYHSARIVAPLLLFSLFLIFNHHLPSRKYILSFLGIFALFFLLFLPILFSKDAQIRFKATNIFNPGARYLNEKDLELNYFNLRIKDQEAGYKEAGRIFHNQRLIYLDSDTLKIAFRNYLSNFDFDFLFVKGDAPLHHAPGFGLLYLWELPFLIAGFIYIIFRGLNRYTLFIIFWMLFVPIPDAVTREAPHAVRSELFLPTFQIITTFGFFTISNIINKQSRWVSHPLILFSVLTLVINQGFYLHQYFIHTNLDISKEWMYGRKEAVELTEKLKHNYDKVIISQKMEQPLNFWLFYTKYPPQKYLSEGGTISGGFADERNHFDKYEFRFFDYHSLPKNEKLLLVGTSVGIFHDFPGGASIIHTIYNKDGSIALQLAENKK